VIPLQLIVAALSGWLAQEQRDVIAFLREENRVLKAQLSGRRVRMTDDQRRRLAVLGRQIGRGMLREIATLVTPDAILRWHRELVACKWTRQRRRVGRPGVQGAIRILVLRMAGENPTWGYTRLQGALRNAGHRVARTTIAKILRDAGMPPVPERPQTWHTFLKAHWPAVVAADFFTTEVWTARGLVTYYTLFFIELASRRVHVLGSTPYPDERFMMQVVRTLTATDSPLPSHAVFISDRDRNWSGAVMALLQSAGARVVQTPVRAPNCNAHAERFVRSIKYQCLNRLVPLGERHLRRSLAEYLAHYHHERNHQGIGNELIVGPPTCTPCGPVRRRQRIGGLLNYYHRAA
jgi:putative transposase